MFGIYKQFQTWPFRYIEKSLFGSQGLKRLLIFLFQRTSSSKREFVITLIIILSLYSQDTQQLNVFKYLKESAIEEFEYIKFI